MLLKQEKQNILYVPKEYAIAHCISFDCVMGAGLAKQISQFYPNMKAVLKSLKTPVGKSIRYYSETDERFIYNLVTKYNFHDKPTYKDITLSLIDMRLNLIVNDLYIKPLAIPKLGCGLDGKQWDRILQIIQKIFNDVDIEILVCTI